jgi:isopentenyl diphosphate isomerase/L-lactate dehydrogenase-like FMN-dependent dehydrogenase
MTTIENNSYKATAKWHEQEVTITYLGEEVRLPFYIVVGAFECIMAEHQTEETKRWAL